MDKKQLILSAGCALVLLLPNIACMVLSSDLTYSWVKEIAYIGVATAALLWPLTFLKRRTYFILAAVLTIPWAPIELSSLYLNKMTVSPHFIALFTHTNRQEVMDVLATVWPLLLLFLLTCILYGMAVSRIDNRYVFSRRMRWVGVGVTLLCVLVATRLEQVQLKLYKIYPYDVYFAYAQLKQEDRQVDQWTQELAHFSFDIAERQDTTEQHYILIIGESARYDHFAINGYERNTSPELDTISGLFSLSDLYTLGNNTYPVIGKLITRADLDSPEKVYTEKSIVEAFQDAGYQTAWLSSQTWMDYIRRIAHTADFRSEQIAGLSADVEKDESLVQSAQQILRDHPAKKTFHVLHCMGSHVKYNQRYTADYERFTPSIREKDGYAILSVGNKDKVVNAYDNTICYTSHVIGEAINTLRQMPGRCCLIYISDHGENLMDDSRNLIAHSSYEGTIHEAHVPCFIWTNAAFREACPDKVSALEQNLHKQVQSDVLFYSLADMADLHEIVVPEKSLFSPHLTEPSSIRMLTGNGQVVNEEF